MRYSKTEVGQQAFKARSPSLSARQRSAFILFDGVKSNDQVLAATGGLGITQDDIDHLVQEGFLAAVPDAVTPDASRAAQPPALPANTLTTQERYVEAMHLATQLTASLGLRGFRLNLALEAASGYDGLAALLPKIKDAVGEKACRQLEHVLKG